jgi:uncharacterized membrane protein HdeD (DUF308 family)
MTPTHAQGRGLYRDPEDLSPGAASIWWLFLITGAAWLLFSLIIFRFNIDTVTGIGILVGVFCIVAAVNELMEISASNGGWKVVRVALAVLFAIIGIAALAYPHRTFVEIAAIFAFILLFKGMFDIVTALMLRKDADLWWIPLIVGVMEVLLAFWAAGNFGRESVLLVVWVGAAALARGVTEIVLAFRLRDLNRDEPPERAAVA